jgi:hypothetical protein
VANRREFLAAGGLGLASLASADGARAAEGVQGVRDLYEIRQYHVDEPGQKDALVAFLRDAAIPALNRLGVSPVGVFSPVKDLGPVYVLLRHKSMETVVAASHGLATDADFLAKGANVLGAPAEKPAYKRMESSLFLAFPSIPAIEAPVKNAGRVFQLRTYESPSVKAGQKKIEMFDVAGEIAIFRRTGLHPVFFGEAILGAKMPNLTYMLGFEGENELDANWKTFIADPEWKRLSDMPEYANKTILSGITNVVLKPVEGSQV